MKGFRKLVMLGVLLVTLLFVIDTIDAGRKQNKKREIETGKEGKNTESVKQDKLKKSGSQRNENFEEENQYVSRSSRFESKKNIKFAPKDKKYTGENTKTSKHFQKLKKSKFFDDELASFDSEKSKLKKTKPQYLRSENVDKIVKTVKKTTQKKLVEENDNEKILSEEMDKLRNEETISVEETVNGNPKKRKYKLVEVVLQEDGQEEEQEGNETSIDLGVEDPELFDIQTEEIIKKTRTTQNPKSFKNKKLLKRSNLAEEDQIEELASEDNFHNVEETAQSDFNEEVPLEMNSYGSRYQDPAPHSCPRIPEDPNRQGPKKLTLYVVEEEINGKIKKRVISEEDGITMCEVADLLKETYMAGPEE